MKKGKNDLFDLHHPHDALFKAAFRNKQVMQDFLQGRLSEALLSKVDLTTLKLENSSFVEENLRQIHSDLVYSIQTMGKQGYIYLLVEAQSTYDKRTPIRLLKYNLRLMEQHLAQHKTDTLPPIFNLVLYSGSKRYEGPKKLIDAFEFKELFYDMFEREFLIDLGLETPDTILKDKQAALVEFILKQSKARDFCKWLMEKEIGVLINNSSYSISALFYIFSIDPHDARDVIGKIHNLDPYKKEQIMSGLQRMIQQGMQQGIQQGMKQGIQQGMEKGMQQGIQQERQDLVEKLLKRGVDKRIIEEALKDQ